MFVEDDARNAPRRQLASLSTSRALANILLDEAWEARFPLLLTPRLSSYISIMNSELRRRAKEAILAPARDPKLPYHDMQHMGRWFTAIELISSVSRPGMRVVDERTN